MPLKKETKLNKYDIKQGNQTKPNSILQINTEISIKQ